MDETKSRPRPRKTAAKACRRTKRRTREGRAREAAPQGVTDPCRSDRETMVRMAAYFRAERRGFAPGYEIEDWLAAEAEVSEPEQATTGREAAQGADRKPRAGWQRHGLSVGSVWRQRHASRKQRVLEAEVVQVAHPHRIEHAIEVVDFVLHDPGVEALDRPVDGLPVDIATPVAQTAIAGHEPAQSRHREAALPAIFERRRRAR